MKAILKFDLTNKSDNRCYQIMLKAEAMYISLMEFRRRLFEKNKCNSYDSDEWCFLSNIRCDLDYILDENNFHWLEGDQ